MAHHFFGQTVFSQELECQQVKVSEEVPTKDLTSSEALAGPDCVPTC